MNRILTLLLLASTIANHAHAQASANGGFGLSRIGFALGGDIDMPIGLDGDYLLSTAERATFSITDAPFESGELTMMDCDNGTARLNFAFANPAAPHLEWQVSLLGITGRIDMVRYEKGEEGSPDFQWMEVNATNKETAVEVVHIRHKRTEKPIGFHWGVGTNLGVSHSGKVHVKGEYIDGTATDSPASVQAFEHNYKQRESLNQRLFLQGGVSVRFLKKMEFGIELRKGLGYRASFGGPFHATFLKRSLGLSLRCKLF
ncbi:MAG: hypothetical protein IPN76_12670 [Saprospiraceae bacterium]|nr:hypothetical protein [Saprospiraceae bacterium]